MTDREERIAELRRQATWEREDLATALAHLKSETDDRRARWAFAGRAATGVAAALMAAWKLFGRNSLAARTGRIASAVGLLLGIGRGVRRLRRFW